MLEKSGRERDKKIIRCLLLSALESSKSATSIELAGYVVWYGVTVEAFVKLFFDPAVNRFVVDPFSLLVMAEPKYKSVKKLLVKLANALKANFLSLDIATID